MPKFRKRPVIVEAEQWFPGRAVDGVHDEGSAPYVITAHEQRAYLAPGDWIIPEPMAGRFYPCKPDIFERTYEAI